MATEIQLKLSIVKNTKQQRRSAHRAEFKSAYTAYLSARTSQEGPYLDGYFAGGSSPRVAAQRAIARVLAAYGED